MAKLGFCNVSVTYVKIISEIVLGLNTTVQIIWGIKQSAFYLYI